MNNQKVCIYRANCVDGFSCAFSIWLNNKDIEFHSFDNTFGEFPNIDNKDVILIGLNIINETVIDLNNKSKSLLLISNIREHNNLKEIEKIICTDKSMCIPTWEYFSKTKPPLFIDYINDYEFSKFKLPFTKEVYSSIITYELTFDKYIQLYNTFIDDLVIEGTAILRKVNKDTNTIIENMFYISFDNINIPTVYIPYFYDSNCIDILVNKYSMGCVFYNINDKFYFLLKSDELDVLTIAKKYGGGGTFNSAGFILKFNDSLIKNYAKI